MPDPDDSELLSPTDWSPSAWRQWAESLDAPANLSIDVKSIRQGRTVIAASDSAWPKNPNGALHGGIVTAAIAHCATIAGAASLTPGSPVRPSAIAVAFLRPAVPPLTLDTHVHEATSSAMFATVTVNAADGRGCATAQVTLSPGEGTMETKSDASPLETREVAQLPGTTANFIPAPVDGDERAWRTWAEQLPASIAMGLRCLAVSPTHATVLMDNNGVGPESAGEVPHGEVVAWADHCFGLVATASVRPGASPATASLSAQFLAPAIAPLTFHATVQKSGRTLAFINVDVRDASDRLVSIVRGTMSVDGTSRFLPPAT